MVILANKHRQLTKKDDANFNLNYFEFDNEDLT